MTRRLSTPLILGAACAGLAPAKAADALEDLNSLSIEELAQIEVQSASKQAEPLSQAPTSIFVITSDDIVRSSATSLPELLRLAPNLQVQRVDADQYAVSARGFNGVESANKLLVRMDGRSLYTTLHSGVFWQLYSPLLEDLAQVEVVSGPGGTLFGPNAVNGVVNIVSKDAQDTLGGLVRASAGARERTAALRYGTMIGPSAAIRFYANGFDRQDMPGGAGPDVNDHFRGWQAGFRADMNGDSGALTLQGDIFGTRIGNVEDDGDRGQNLLARWSRQLGAGTSVQVQAYYDDYRRRAVGVLDTIQTFDLETQVNASAGRHDFVAGFGLRTTRDRFVNSLNPFVLDPERKRLWIGNVFAQDRVALSDRVDLVAGIKLEQSSFSGLEVLPNLRIAWHPSDRILLWTAVSRAVRTPSRIDRQLTFPGFLAPATDFRSEKLVALEAGYRGQPTPTTTLSVSVFYNLYDDIRTTNLANTPDGLPIKLGNDLSGETYGLEAWITQQILPHWRASLGVSTLGKRFKVKPGVIDISAGASLGFDPDYQVTARSEVDLTDRLQLDLGLRAVDDLENPHLAAYLEGDARLNWRATDALDLYVAGNNLLHATHQESNDANRAQRIARSVYVGARIRF
jgi:iron complex outermembrane receptor protein